MKMIVVKYKQYYVFFKHFYAVTCDHSKFYNVDVKQVQAVLVL